MGHNGIDVQFVGAVAGCHPVFGGVVIAVLLGGSGRGEQGNNENRRQHQGCHALPTGFNAFVHIVVILQILIFGMKKPQSEAAVKLMALFFYFPKKNVANARHLKDQSFIIPAR
jgi:hypothetical protein